MYDFGSNVKTDPLSFLGKAFALSDWQSLVLFNQRLNDRMRPNTVTNTYKHQSMWQRHYDHCDIQVMVGPNLRYQIMRSHRIYDRLYDIVIIIDSDIVWYDWSVRLILTDTIHRRTPEPWSCTSRRSFLLDPQQVGSPGLSDFWMQRTWQDMARPFMLGVAQIWLYTDIHRHK